MPKTSYAMSQSCAKVEIQPGCTGTRIDISGTAATVTLPMQSVSTASQAVFDDTEHVLGAGKKEPVQVTIRFVYTEQAGEAFESILSAWNALDCNTQMCVYISPAGGGVGDREIIVTGLLSGLKPPDVDAGTPDVALAEMQVFGYYTYAVVT